jgi:hypothetical protein
MCFAGLCDLSSACAFFVWRLSSGFRDICSLHEFEMQSALIGYRYPNAGCRPWVAEQFALLANGTNLLADGSFCAATILGSSRISCTLH